MCQYFPQQVSLSVTTFLCSHLIAAVGEMLFLLKVSSEPPVDTKVHRPQIVEKVVEVPKVRISVPQNAKALEFEAWIRFWVVHIYVSVRYCTL